jgi:hypothetical protein
MAWTPTYNTLNLRAIASNLMTFFNTNQDEALKWANDGTPLKKFGELAVRVQDIDKPLFPALQFSDDDDAVDYSGDISVGAYSVTFEGLIQNAKPDKATLEARKYSKALVSMIREIPDADIVEDTGAVVVVLQQIDTAFEPIKKHKDINSFLQEFKVKATFSVTGANYE